MFSQPTNDRKKPVEKKIVRTVKQAIAEHSMFQTGDRVLVAVSGGADSVALIYLLETLAPPRPAFFISTGNCPPESLFA
jgi:tRNA(Ile)-lysidine synthase TilS/MesJ